MELNNKRIIISKTNQIGDVIFALPLASAIKQAAPKATVIFMGREYTRDLIEHYRDVDEFLDGDTVTAKDLKGADIIIHVHPNKHIAYLAKQAGIPLRIGTSTRLYHWFTCNRRLKISRKDSVLHETQLDMQYLKALDLKGDYTLDEITALRHFLPFKLQRSVGKYLARNKFNLIIHSKTRGEHIEWPLAHYAKLIDSLSRNTFHIVITGSAAEGEKVRDQLITPFPHVTNLCGVLTLDELQSLIAHADGLIASSTGPVHLAAAFGIHTLGLYAPIKPFHAGRWGPVGEQAQVPSVDKDCDWCRDGRRCKCVGEITVDEVKAVVTGWVR